MLKANEYDRCLKMVFSSILSAIYGNLYCDPSFIWSFNHVNQTGWNNDSWCIKGACGSCHHCACLCNLACLPGDWAGMVYFHCSVFACNSVQKIGCMPNDKMPLTLIAIFFKKNCSKWSLPGFWIYMFFMAGCICQLWCCTADSLTLHAELGSTCGRSVFRCICGNFFTVICSGLCHLDAQYSYRAGILLLQRILCFVVVVVAKMIIFNMYTQEWSTFRPRNFFSLPKLIVELFQIIIFIL